METMQKCGTTFRKIRYIHNIARLIVEGKVNLDELTALPDEKFCKELIKLPGIGKWTAEILLIHSLLRPDVLSYDDIAIRRGMRMVYRHQEISKEQFERYRRRYSPYGTIASIYLWCVAGGAIPGLTDPAIRKKHRK